MLIVLYTPEGSIPVERRIKIVTVVRVKLILESVSHLRVRKVRQT